MPETWDAELYRRRAEGWQTRADSLPEGPDKDACLQLAQGYVRLAHFIEARAFTRSEAERLRAEETATSFGVVCADGTIVPHTGSLGSAIQLACDLEGTGHAVMRIDQGVSTALEGENLRMAIGGRSSL